MKDAIDRYKDAADRNQIRVEIGSEGYPPDLETLVKGVQLGASSDRKIRFCGRFNRPDDRAARFGTARGSGRSGFHELGRQERVDVYSKSTGNGAGWNKVFQTGSLNGELN